MKGYFSLVVLIMCFLSSSAQKVDFTIKDFILSGTTKVVGQDQFMLTDNKNWQGGGAWYKDDIDLNEPFNMEIEVYFGCSDEGADGIVFIFHPELRTGFAGEGMGFGGLFPSFGVEMDTYENYHLGDPSFDHVSLMAHGMLRHPFGITKPVSLDANKKNVEDCDYHKVKVAWNPSSSIFSFSFDGAMRIEEEIDLVEDVFEGNPNVYWGFTSATGGKYNKHLIKVKKIEFTENPSLKSEDKTALLRGDKYTLKKLNFSSGSTKLPDSAKPELDKLYHFLKRFPNHSVIIDSFTDSSGKESSNLRISKLRAEAVAKYLKSKGINENRLYFYGNGETNPIDSNDTEEGRKNNRRTEIRMKIIKV
ncbi:lectin-like domain-containing protein [Portibacter lacus]|uniref:OmpA-like domain-containing protein n=1 Tax=Portibacter lacus TaxID=1099794 RepID=A0AA37WHE1_9BACT|nr:OmpA family protein [Portibacter lacus]GLR18675.1 hypothetical protein GCM10007940_32910 [Portibacter lacus]